MLNKLAFMRQGMETQRYHVVPTLQANTVAHHSCGVALLCMLLDPTDHGLLQAALLHDLAEHRVGDVPADSKRRLPLAAKDAFDLLEEGELRMAGLHNDLTTGQQRLLKLADCMDGALFCVRERMLGNRLIADTYTNYARYIQQMQPAGVAADIFAIIQEDWSRANG